MSESKAPDGTEENDRYQILDGALFLDEETELLHVDICGEMEALESGTMACTEHDLTGQIVWPVSRLLALYVCGDKARFHGKTVLELGAGAGLTGIVAARYASNTLVTDGNDVVLRLLDRNAERARREGNRRIECCSLEWEQPQRDRDLERCLRRLGGPPDILLGADVVQWPAAIVPLVETVATLLTQAADGAFFACGLTARSQWLRREFLEACCEFGLGVSSWAGTAAAISADPTLQVSQERDMMEVLLVRPVGSRLEHT